MSTSAPERDPAKVCPICGRPKLRRYATCSRKCGGAYRRQRTDQQLFRLMEQRSGTGAPWPRLARDVGLNPLSLARTLARHGYAEHSAAAFREARAEV